MQTKKITIPVVLILEVVVSTECDKNKRLTRDEMIDGAKAEAGEMLLGLKSDIDDVEIADFEIADFAATQINDASAVNGVKVESFRVKVNN